LTALGALAAGVAALVLPVVAAEASAPARVLVAADEFHLSPSRSSIPSGPAIIQLVNYGEDSHDLVLRRPGAVSRHLSRVTPGGHGELEASLPPGRYRLWCSIADHRARGMETVLIVRRR
jgi:plastocyanin